jgi:hypothetical protein
MENDTYQLRQQRPLNMNGLRPRTTVPRARLAPARRMYFKSRPETQRREHRWLQKIHLPLLLLAGLGGGFFADSLVLGMALLAAYGIYAFVTNIPSRTTFTLALLILAAISLLLLFKPNLDLIRNFATYTFVLLLIGVITLGKEAKMPKRMPRKYRRR